MKKLNLKEIVVLAMISVVMGVAFQGLDIIYMPLVTVLGPIGGAIIYGIYLISALLSMYIVRKPGAGLIGSLLTGVVNLLLGSPYGIHIIVASLLQGLGVEIAGIMSKYEKFDLVNMSIGAILAMIFVTVRDYFVFGFGELGPMMPTIMLVRTISAIILGALLSILIGKGIAKTGVLDSFEIGKDE